jgi:hypothetical protein
MRTLLLILLAACDPTTFDIADKIAAHSTGTIVTKGGGKFVNVEYPSTAEQCNELQAYARTIKDPPDCVRVRCKLPDGETDMLVGYDGLWHGGSGSYPRCAK